jgi:hypothetical protein
VIHCLFHLNQGFKFTAFSKAFCSSFQMYWFFPYKLRVFFKVRKKNYFFFLILCSRYTYTHIYIYMYISIYLFIYLSIYLYPCVCTSNDQYCDVNARQRQHVEWWIG